MSTETTSGRDGMTVYETIAVGIRPSTRTVFIATEGGRVDIPPEQVADVAAMLASWCTDNDQRAFVRSEWYELDPEDIEEIEAEWAKDPAVENARIGLIP